MGYISSPPRLSTLVVDADKDWQDKRIENLGSPDSGDDAKREDSPPADHHGRHESGGADEVALAADQVVSGRFPMTRMPDMAAGKVMLGQGAGSSPVETDLPEAEVGGKYGINVETLTGDKTLTPGTDEIYQYLDEGGANRIITLATVEASAGDRFVIRHNGAYDDMHYLEVKQGATSLDDIYAGAIKEFVFDGANWVSQRAGTGESDNKKYNVAIGRNAEGSGRGTAVGADARGSDSGVAVGQGATGINHGAAVGYGCQGASYGIAMGHWANNNVKKYSIALGYCSQCERYGETSINIDGDFNQKNIAVQGRWSGSTTNNTPKEIFCAGVSNKRFTIVAQSALAFRMIIVARDDVANEAAMYRVDDGLIKRDNAGNTALVSGTVIVVHEDDAGWDVTITADDANEALIITVTGDAVNPVQWAVVMDGVETHF